MTKLSGKIIVDPEIGEVQIVKSSRSRSISIRVHPVRGVRVSVPNRSTGRWDGSLSWWKKLCFEGIKYKISLDLM